jgi:hypothetical protein
MTNWATFWFYDPGLLRGVCHQARIRATRGLAMTTEATFGVHLGYRNEKHSRSRPNRFPITLQLAARKLREIGAEAF